METISPSYVTNAISCDGLGRVASSKDGRGNATTFLYNALGQRICAVDAATSPPRRMRIWADPEDIDRAKISIKSHDKAIEIHWRNVIQYRHETEAVQQVLP